MTLTNILNTAIRGAFAVGALKLNDLRLHVLAVAFVLASVLPCSYALAAESSSINECNRLAESPYDPSRVTDGVPSDKIDASAAVAACSRAVSENPDNIRLSFQYGRALEAAKRYDEAFKWYRKAADQGNALAQTNLGGMYTKGSGVAKDGMEAAKWFRKAADQGFAVAQFNLGLLYANGSGVAKDEVEAVKWDRKAADQGLANAQFNLGLMYANGWGVAKDGAEAVKWFRKAGDQGNGFAQTNLGWMYANGVGVSKNEVEAVKWYRKAADQGLAIAQNNLGGMYANGLGVSKNEAEAVKWYGKAADQGLVIAQKNLRTLLKNGQDIVKDGTETSVPANPETSTLPLSTNEVAHFKETLSNGKPAQLYFLAMQMSNTGHVDLANELYQKMVDKYPDDIYTAKAIDKLDRSSRAMGSGSQQTSAHAKEMHDACLALCESQARQCNSDALGDAAPGATKALTGAGSGDLMGAMSGLASVLISSNKDCDAPLRACRAACPLAP